MTTDQATAKLAEIYRTGDADTSAERAAILHLVRVVRYVSERDWLQADYHLEAAYYVLSAELPPGATIDMWNRTTHPIQLEAERQYQEQVESCWQ